jgi:hypothetical protein
MFASRKPTKIFLSNFQYRMTYRDKWRTVVNMARSLGSHKTWGTSVIVEDAFALLGRISCTKLLVTLLFIYKINMNYRNKYVTFSSPSSSNGNTNRTHTFRAATMLLFHVLERCYLNKIGTNVSLNIEAR